jgi:cell division protein FtsZ
MNKRLNNSIIKVVGCGSLGSGIAGAMSQNYPRQADYFSPQGKGVVDLFAYRNAKESNKDIKIISLDLIEKNMDFDNEKIEKALTGGKLALIVGDTNESEALKQIEHIAKIARDKGLLTIGVLQASHKVNESPNLSEGKKLDDLVQLFDTIVPVIGETTNDLAELPKKTMLYYSERMLEIFIEEVLISIDFEDAQAIFKNRGICYVGTGEGYGDKRIDEAVRGALNEKNNAISIRDVASLLITIAGGPDFTLLNINETIMKVQEELGDDIEIVFSAIVDEGLEGGIRVSIIGVK